MANEEDTAIAVTDPFARRLMAQYLDRRAKDLKTLSAALADLDFATIELIGHKLFGSGSAYGLNEVTRLGGELESAAQSQNSQEIVALIQEYAAYTNRLKLT